MHHNNQKRDYDPTTTDTATMTETTSVPSNGDGDGNGATTRSRSARQEQISFDNLPETRMRTRIATTKTLNMNFLKSLSGLCCQECGTDPLNYTALNDNENNDNGNDKDIPSELYNLQQAMQQRTSSSISPLVSVPMMSSFVSSNNDDNNKSTTTTTATKTTIGSVEQLLGEYMCLCQFYKLPYNAGVLTTLRFRLPSLRVSGSFHDDDMLALVELLLRHANTRLQFITRLDFTIASKEGTRSDSGFDKSGFTSHGALTLAKLLQTTQYIRQVWLPRHRIGPYGASALFWACRDNPTIHTLHLRRCRIGERGAFAFCEMIAASSSNNNKNNDAGGGGLQDVDLSSNGIGHRGTVAIERAMERRNQDNLKNKTTNNNGTTTTPVLFVNLEGNLVLPEVRNTVTVAVAGCTVRYCAVLCCAVSQGAIYIIYVVSYCIGGSLSYTTHSVLECTLLLLSIYFRLSMALPMASASS
jgi:hypothetical protein